MNIIYPDTFIEFCQRRVKELEAQATGMIELINGRNEDKIGFESLRMKLFASEGPIHFIKWIRTLGSEDITRIMNDGGHPPTISLKEAKELCDWVRYRIVLMVFEHPSIADKLYVNMILSMLPYYHEYLRYYVNDIYQNTAIERSIITDKITTRLGIDYDSPLRELIFKATE